MGNAAPGGGRPGRMDLEPRVPAPGSGAPGPVPHAVRGHVDLLHGWVKIVSVSEDGHESVLALRGAGDIVGEAAGETTGGRNATMKALLAVRALVVGYGRFSSFLDTHQGGSRAYRRVMSHRWR